MRERDIAILITCYNRRETTLACLRALTEQQLPTGYRFRVLLTDDGCTDGTGAAIRAEFPEVTVLEGDGNLYWVGGTQLAWNAAGVADFYLWLNDDVQLRPGALSTLVKTFESREDDSVIVVGATCDPAVGKTCTGGMRRDGWYRVRVLAPTDVPQLCDSMNGNIVLVPWRAYERLGGLDPAYVHYFADGDYGLRARKLGIPLVLAPGHLGECRLNPLANSSFDHALPLRERWRRMIGPKGYRPPGQWWAFVRAHAPRPKVAFWAMPYLLFGLEALGGGRLRLRRNVQRPMEAA